MLDLAQQRYSCKGFIPKRPLTVEQITRLKQSVQLAPSSINSQPWVVFDAATSAGKAKVIAGMPGDHYAYNAQKVADCSHVFVLCTRKSFDDSHLSALLEQEKKDGRITSVEAFNKMRDTRVFYIGTHKTAGDTDHWLEKQTYIALGNLLLAAEAEGLNACPIEGFDAQAMDHSLGLKARGLKPTAVVVVGYSSDADFNRGTPKSRLPLAAICQSLD